MLVCLLAHANTVVPIPRLVDELWGDEPPASAVNVLQSYVSQLRKALGRDAIETSGKGYLARVRSDGLDLIRFERCGAHGEPGAGRRALRGRVRGPG